MGFTFAEKALARAAGLPHAVAGQIVDAQPDVALSHDNTAPIARTFREIGARRVRFPERLAITLDHAVPAPTTQHAQNHAEIRRFVADQGIAHFFEAGRGICHQVISEEALVWPGQLILGSDSHTTHFGWLGAYGAGVGRSEMAAIWATGELWLRVPETIRIDLIGALPPGVTAKDLSLWVLRQLGPDAGIYTALEFGGPGLASLSLESRMVIPNMMAEAGAKNAYLEPDDAVFDWLARRVAARTDETEAACRARIAQGALYPDPDATYQARYTIDLAALEPLVARPHNPANVVPLSQVSGVHVDQAFLGTCTNGRLEDLAAAAAVLRDADGAARRVAPGTRLLVIPASSQVLQDAMAAGYIQTFLACGRDDRHAGLRAVHGQPHGRSGRERGHDQQRQPQLQRPHGHPRQRSLPGQPGGGGRERGAGADRWTGGVGSWKLEDWKLEARSWKLETARSRAWKLEPGNLEAESGIAVQFQLPASSSQQPASSNQLPVSGRAWVYGDNVNTDVIFPGKYTYTISDPAEMARHALEDLDPTFAGAVQQGDIIVAGKNWGCGSSREQAATCLRAAGVQAIIAASFARIFFRNAVNNGLLPIACPEAAAVIQPGEVVTVDVGRCVVRCAAGEFPFPPLSDSLRRIVEAGGLVPMLKQTIMASEAGRQSNDDDLSDPRRRRGAGGDPRGRARAGSDPA